jgi:hypothetical protein
MMTFADFFFDLSEGRVNLGKFGAAFTLCSSGM